MKKSDIIYYLQILFNILMDITISNLSNIFFFKLCLKMIDTTYRMLLVAFNTVCYNAIQMVIKKMTPFIIILRVIPRTTGYSHLHSDIETLNMLNAPRTYNARIIHKQAGVDGVTRVDIRHCSGLITLSFGGTKKKFRHCQTALLSPALTSHPIRSDSRFYPSVLHPREQGVTLV